EQRQRKYADNMKETIEISDELKNENDYKAYEFLAQLQWQIVSSNKEKVVLDFRKCEFSNAIFSSFIGAMKYIGSGMGKELNFITADNSELDLYFKRSEILKDRLKYGESYVNKNTIPFRKVDMNDDTVIDYISNILNLAPIDLTERCAEVLFKNIFEIFNNAVEKSNARYGVYSCGHWMPKKKQLMFSVYDTGIGIPNLVKKNISRDFSSYDAIMWSLERGNSTKQLEFGTPRGLGLADLKDFIRLNNGTLTIFTNDIFFQQKGNTVSANLLSYPILGTFIGITIVADYNHVYMVRE
ncbi:MAG: ATP-binding protein, partial [Lachnospiraceae bacterium]|nr:ATP-binding protein [Lachnospiraceae bacterium]